jgi:hypothetical protein
MADVVILTGTLIEQATPTRAIQKERVKRPLYRTAGPYVIAHHLRKHDISVQVIDYIQFLTSEQLLNFIRKFLPKDKNKPCILGISTTFLQMEEKNLPKHILEAIKTIKVEHPNLTLVAGGAKAHQIQLKANGIAYAIYSYSEDVTLKLFNGLLGRTPLDHTFKLNNKKIIQDNTEFDQVESDFRFIDEDCIRPGEALPLEISRGCIFKCRFCRFPYIGKKKNDYIRCVEQIRAELIYNYEKFGTTNYYILDDTFNETPEKVKDFHDMVQTLPFKISWCAYLRIDLIHRFPETAVWLKDSGLVGAFFGIESFHPEASAIVGKGWAGKHGKDYILELKNNIWGDDVLMTISLIMGIPPETWEDILETERWLEDNNMDSWGWHGLGMSGKPDKTDQSEFEKNPEKYGFTFPNPDDYNDWHHPLITKKEVDEWYKISIATFKLPPKIGAWDVIEVFNYFDKDLAMSAELLANHKLEIAEKRATYTKLYFKMLKELPDAE